jgi:DNA-binding MltR family transcriptional regulator
VILASAIVDQLLESLSLAYLPKLPEERVLKIFLHPGPLSSYAAKKKFAYALGLVDEDTLANLNGIQRVRNAFAHPRGFLHFSSPEVAEVFKRIKHWPANNDLKALFDERVSLVAKAIDGKFNSLVYAHASR